MYLDFFKFKKYPFQLKPDPDFLYLSKAHARAKAYMEYTIWNRDGFLVVTGEIGSGKTTLIKELVSNLDDSVVVANIHQTQLDETEFLQVFLASFGIEAWDAKKPQLLSLVKQFLAEQKELGKQVLLIVDEAQHLSKKALEEIRLLAAVEIDGEETLSFILVGHPELMKTINAPDMEQLSQRIRLRYHIDALSPEDVKKYISTRILLAGCSNRNIFPEPLLPLIYEYTGGIPRLVNILCHAALMTANVEESQVVTEDILRTAAAELEWQRYEEREHRNRKQKKVEPKENSVPLLVCMKSGEKIGEYLIERNRVSIGRHEYNEIVIDDLQVGRCHAEIISQNGISLLKDLSSRNGTYLNDERITERPLIFGDTIRILDREFLYIEGTTGNNGELSVDNTGSEPQSGQKRKRRSSSSRKLNIVVSDIMSSKST